MSDEAMRLAQCEETRRRVARGDGVIGILPVEEIDQMVANYRRLGEAGSAEAWYGLARYHTDENGLHLSIEDAVDAAARAVALGSVPARETLRALLPLHRGEALSDPASATAAYEALDRAAETDGTGRAAYLLGLATFHGFGCAKDLARNVALQRKAAAAGQADAMFELYVLTATGAGIEKDEAAALPWCVQAAKAGHARAAYNMGAFYATGRGVEEDAAKARHWYGIASDAGYGRATATLALMTLQGEGGEPDAEEAEDLFALADEQGFDVETFREELGI